MSEKWSAVGTHCSTLTDELASVFKTTYVSLRVGRLRIRHELLVYGRTRAVSCTHRFIFPFHTSGQTQDDELTTSLGKLHFRFSKNKKQKT